MRTAIIYATKHGCTDKCAYTLANELEANTTVVNLETERNINITEYETVIIGGSIHAGMINKKIKSFIDKNLDTLSKKKLGLFLCCMYEGEKALEQFQVAHGLFGGEFDFDKMNLLEKAIVKKVANVEQSVSRINYANIKGFAEKILK